LRKVSTLVAGQVSNVCPTALASPTSIGKEEVGLLRSVEKLPVTGVSTAGGAARLRVRLANLVWEANTSAGA
jgi:hypothetical protein